MYLYMYILLISTILQEIKSEENSDLVISEGLAAPEPFSIGLIFLLQINNTSDDNDYDVEITPDRCCLVDGEVDCNSVNILGGCIDFVPKASSKNLKLIAPLLDVYDRTGKCIVYVDSKSNGGEDKRDVVRIQFDTRAKTNFDLPSNFKHCSNIDEDPLNDCKPVNCETYYNGKKSYYSRKLKRCVEVPACISDTDYPNVVYNPTTNNCVRESINENDYKFLKNLDRQGRSRTGKDIFIIGDFEPNVTEFIDMLEVFDTTSSSKVIHVNNNLKINCFKSFFAKYFVNNKWTLLILSLVITVQCVMICTMLYCLSKTCNCWEDKKVVSKFFNYRQDVSVTTPLIGTSNVDTETDYQYLNESNVDQKFKSYKACKKDDVYMKMTVSDDILSKCLNRRDWKKFQSETTDEHNGDAAKCSQDIRSISFDTKGKSETKVVFEDEVKDSLNKDRKNKISNTDKNEEKFEDCQRDSQKVDTYSEKEIKCYSYNNTNDTNFVKSNDCYNAEVSQNVIKSLSKEKGAQAYFSNDSIDDFLSERGVVYMAGEDFSKYTFSNDSSDIKPSSSKTSKNFLKNVFSLLHKKSKLGTSSDPGVNKEVQLIHMSKASVYSSSNDSSYMKTLNKNDSRTSF